jgi:hypothetical protein
MAGTCAGGLAGVFTFTLPGLMRHLPLSIHYTSYTAQPTMSSYPAPTRMIQTLQENIGETTMMSWPIKDYPLNIRPVCPHIT